MSLHTISRRRLFAAVLFMLLPFQAACSSDEQTVLDDPITTGRELATEFLTILGTEEAAGLDEFLAEGFQLQRADGSGATKAEYLAEHAVVETFTIGETLAAVQQGDLLTVRWTVVVDESVNGQEYTSNEAPRLSVFVREDGRWKMLAHANFNLPN